MTRFELTAVVEGTGTVKHIIRAKTADLAFMRLCRAYPHAMPVLVQNKKLGAS